jgi:PAS domain S-box-containing protein
MNGQRKSPFPNSGEMGKRMQALDWAQTPVGPVESWSQSLKSTVRTLLGSRYPMILLWEQELVQIYNDAYINLIGTKHPGALGRSIRQTQAESWDVIGPMIAQVMTTGIPNWVEDQMLAVNRAGYNEEAHFSLSYSAVEDDEGVIRGMLCVCSEVTIQVLGERRLRLQRDLAARGGETRSVDATCSDILEAIAEYPLDVPFALIYLREQDDQTLRLYGSVRVDTNEEIAPTTVAIETSTDLWPFTKVMAGDTAIVEGIDRYVSIPGGPWGERVHQAIALPIPSSNVSAPLGVLIAGISPNCALDESYQSFYELLAGQVSVSIRNAQAYEEERRRAEMLAEIDRAKTVFFSNVSHEFRTPLTLMLNPLEDVLQSGNLPTAEREQIAVAHRNSLRLLKLVNTLLDFSRIEAGRIQAVYEPTDLATLTTDLASVFRSAIEKAGLQLVVDCPPLSEPVYVDRDMWEKIVLNLLSNAFKFTFEGEISVSLHPVEDSVELVVKDTGTGIPARELPHLFERFHRVAGAQGRSYEGSGIGLSLVQELVKLHGGTVAVSSVLDEGSTFVVRLPMGSVHLPPEHIQATRTQTSTASGAISYIEEALGWVAQTSEDPSSSGEALPHRSSARILLADDNADMRHYLQRLLSQHYDVEAVADGQAALEAIRAQVPDLVLTDVMMPRLDGFGLLRELRAEPQTRAIPILLLSARAGEEAAVEGLAAGADDYLVKPFSARELLARVATNLELGRSRQATARRRIESILESITDGFIAIDRQWRCVYANQEAEDLLQKSRSELLGQVMWEVFPDWVGSPFEAALRQAAEQQITVELDQFYPALNTWFELRIYPASEGLSAYFHNISERKQAEAALRESEAKFRTIADTMPQIVWSTTTDGYHDYFNQRWYEYTGMPHTDDQGWHWKDYLHPDDYDRAVEIWQHSLKTGEPYEVEYRFRRAEDGAYRWFIGRALPIRDEQGQVIRWFGTCTDIDEQRRLLEQREQWLERERAARTESERVSRMKDEFLATLSHELRTPLNAILGWSQLLRKGGLKPEMVEQGMNTIDRNVRMQAQLIEDLLDMNRIISGKIRLDVQRVDLVSVIEAALETVRLAAEAKEIRLQKVLDPLAGVVSGDPARLQQIVWNLVSNAIKFTPKGGRVLVILERVRSHVEISVIDTGQGIEPEFLPYVFERFRQADGSTTRRHGGLGLGLSIVRSLTELHGGTVRAESAGAGLGATFVVALPLVAVHAKTVEPEELTLQIGDNASTDPDAPNLSGLNVLVVDDEPDARELIKVILQQAQASVITAGSTVQAFELLESHKPDVLVSDIGMPEEDGYQFIRQVRSLPPAQGGKIPAIALTAYARQEDRKLALLSGYQMHITKPVEPSELIAVISSLASLMERR